MKSFWLDQKLLDLTSQFVKKFNWLTGKDNFWLARQLTIASGLNFMAYLFFIAHDRTASILFTLVIYSILIIIGMTELASEKRSEVKIFEVELVFILLRMTFLLPSLLIVALNFIDLLSSAANKNVIFIEIWAFSSAASAYLVSIERPPFSKSKALEWLREQTKFDLPVLKPIPIPVKK